MTATVTVMPNGYVVDGLTSAQVIERAGITYRMLDFWVRSGHVECQGDPRPGSGYPRTWTTAEASLVIQVADLVRAGFTVPRAVEIAHELRETSTVRLGPGITLTEAQA